MYNVLREPYDNGASAHRPPDSEHWRNGYQRAAGKFDRQLVHLCGFGGGFARSPVRTIRTESLRPDQRPSRRGPGVGDRMAEPAARSLISRGFFDAIRIKVRSEGTVRTRRSMWHPDPSKNRLRFGLRSALNGKDRRVSFASIVFFLIFSAMLRARKI